MPLPLWAAEGRGGERVALSTRRSPRAPAPVKILLFPCCHFSFASRPLCWERDPTARVPPSEGGLPSGYKVPLPPQNSQPRTESVCVCTKFRYRVDGPRNRIVCVPSPPLPPLPAGTPCNFAASSSCSCLPRRENIVMQEG